MLPAERPAIYKHFERHRIVSDEITDDVLSHFDDQSSSITFLVGENGS